MIAGAAAADRGAALIPEAGDVLRARTRNDPETGTGGPEPGPGRIGARLLCDGSS